MSRKGAAAAWLVSILIPAGLVALLLHLRPWRRPIDGPLMVVSQTGANRITTFRIDGMERPLFGVDVHCQGPFGLAVSPDHRRLYAACTDDSRISVVDLEERREARVFDSRPLAAWVQWRPGSREVWITNEGGRSVTIYDGESSEVIDEIVTGDGPSDVVFTPDGAVALISNEASATVSWIDAVRREKRLDIPVGEVPQGMALTPDGQFLVVANYGSNDVSLIRMADAREVARVPTAPGPVDVAIPRAGYAGLAFVSCNTEGVVSVVDVNERREVRRIPVGSQVFGIASHPTRDRLYVCSAGTGEIVVLGAGREASVLRRLPLEGSPNQITVSPGALDSASLRPEP